ncbi:MAG TPA: WXG100 family type VII secretion target [Actinomadura sp.]|nr:WXG100 family type VII secretion target [Actinomadura sp.]
MGEQFSANYPVMQAAEQVFQQQHRNMTEALDQLEAEVANGLALWEDDARDAFFEAKAKWDKAAEKQAKSIKEFGQVVRTASTNYQKAEQSGVRMWEG